MAYNKTTKEYVGYIYIIVNKINQNQYIGQTTRTLAIRKSQHLKDSQSKEKQHITLYRAINKYGIDNFNMICVESISCSTKEELIDKLNILEQYHIEQLDTYNNGYNMTVGGDKRNYIAKAVCKYSLDGILLEKYPSMTDASLRNNIHLTCVYEACTGVQNTSGGFIWAIEGEKPQLKKRAKQWKIRSIEQYDLDGNFIASFERMTDAVKLTNTCQSSISHVCNGKRKTAGGFVWKYTEQ